MTKPFFNIIQDILILFVSLFILATLCSVLAFPTWSYLTVNLALGIFLIPGWLLSRHFQQTENSIGFRFLLASFISFTLYGLVAFLCTIVHLNFTWFYVLYALAILFSFVFVYQKCQTNEFKNPLQNLRLEEIILSLLLIIFVILIFRYPPSSDLDIFLFESIDYLNNQNFNTSILGISQHGLTEAPPRWGAHFYHVFFSLLSHSTNLDLLSLTYYLVTIPLGGLMILALYQFVRTVVGPKIPMVYLVFAITAPLLFFYTDIPHTFDDAHYKFSFRLLNSPALDKDMAQYFILPTLLCLSVLYIKTHTRHYLTLLLTATPLILYFHPLICVYYFLALIALTIGFYHRNNRKRLIHLIVFCCALLVTFLFLKPQGKSHHLIDELIIDANKQWSSPIYWPGHYGATQDTNAIKHIGGTMMISPQMIFVQNNLIRASLIASLIWMFLIFYRQVNEDEKQSWRVQVGFLTVLLTIFVIAPAIFATKPYLHRGIERLHWVYLGFFSLCFVPYHLFRLKKWGHTVAYALMMLMLIDHITALPHHQFTWSQKVPFIKSFANAPYLLTKNEGTPYFFKNHPPEQLDKNSPLTKSSWMKDDDIIYVQAGNCLHYDMLTCYQIKKRSIYYNENYHEAFAYSQKGEPFLEEFRAFYDGFFGQISPRFMAWIQQKNPSVIISQNKEFVQKLTQTWNRAARVIDQKNNLTVWRIFPP